MAAALPTPDDCRCECLSTIPSSGGGGGGTSNVPQQVYSGFGPPAGLQTGVGGIVQNPVYDAIYTDKVTGITYHWNTTTLAWDF